jgi:hypothetical protein
MQEHSKIKKLLETVRSNSSTGLVDQNASDLLEWVNSMDVSLEEIGTSEDELKRLINEGQVSQAKSFLAIAREMKSKSYVRIAIMMVKKHAGEAAISLEEIGTSEEELEEIFRYPKTE